jgi:aspartyl/asparaginyl beta-hydroxylase (cupin superfamily)
LNIHANSQRIEALIAAAVEAMQRRDPRSALAVLEEAQALQPDTPDVHLNKALAYRLLGDLDSALASLDAVLALEPYHFMALISKGAMIERTAGPRKAAPVYKNALKIAPPDGQLAPGLAKAVEAAKAVVQAEAVNLQRHLKERTRDLRALYADKGLERFDESLDVFAGVARAYLQEPVLLNYTRLPAIPFHDRAQFPWLEELEAATPYIVDELAALLGDEAQEFGPYIQYPAGAPVNQWGELNHSRRWTSYGLWLNGVKQEAACRRCPRTAALMERLPLMEQPGFAPTVNFSALQPHTHIPPHTGSSNTRLLGHLPLILPGPARFRVGNEMRSWRMGEAWIFDDTIEHEAWNDADEMRVILIFDIWNPALSEAERALLCAMQTAKNEYQTA